MNETLAVADITFGVSSDFSNSGVGRATKKVHRRLNLPADTEDETVDGNGRKIEETDTPKLSYKRFCSFVMYSLMLCNNQNSSFISFEITNLFTKPENLNHIGIWLKLSQMLKVLLI
ncbi:hypothetical protein PVK06_015548 [Gossypium arboreum]|uniref:Uncharacterized protein n=1 Tax=Gossypium arboreum TaxID=29729 RepID=A0ABR0PXV6_GOSAR|nr:hypothetical protein PVK06_015548 [Gossypium arboreum]